MTPQTNTPITTTTSHDSLSTPTTLTVIVTNDKDQKTSGARVTMDPSGATGLTDAQGQVQFKLGNASKYNVTVTLDSNTVTVPYYVTSGGSARLMVNPTYVKAAEARIANSQHGWLRAHSNVLFSGGFILIVIIVLWILLRRFRHKSRRR